MNFYWWTILWDLMWYIIYFSFSMGRRVFFFRDCSREPAVGVPCGCLRLVPPHPTRPWDGLPPCSRVLRRGREGLGLVAIGLGSRESGIFGFAIDCNCVSPKIRYLLISTGWMSDIKPKKSLDLVSNARYSGALRAPRLIIVISIKNQSKPRDESPNHGLHVVVWGTCTYYTCTHSLLVQVIPFIFN